ncbi:CD151 antigen-like [Lytechinus variegatus]|uniref:CD151 antigen-like n=1 Tax=Lytechinus variegatus TaxID=7654 RepID=UPI001BB27A59|nr:CD151 antigen-like [Lytechinus variegatus]XP_041471918.1 CD151 antigen-like [Lytechinus variegatus]
MEIEEDPPTPKPPLSEKGQCYRVVLYCLNVFFVFTGVAMVAIGVWVQLDPINEQVALLLGNDLFKMAGKAIVLGGIMILIVSLLGCVGARLENKCLLKMYFYFLLLVFVVEFSGGILGLAFLASAETEQNLTWSLRDNYGAEGGEEYTEAYDFIQKRFRCCGITGDVVAAVIEYRMTAFWLNQSPLKPRNVVPLSCCREGVDPVICRLERPQNLYRLYLHDVGCLTATENRVTEYGGVVGGVAICISVLHLAGMVFTFCLYREVPRSR